MYEKHDNAEIAASAVIEAGKNWEELTDSISRIAKTGLSKTAVIALISDECGIAMETAASVVDSLSAFPVNYPRLVAAA